MIRFGVCAKFEQLDAVIDSGYDYVEFNLSKVAALSDPEFAELEKRIQNSPLKAEAFNGFFPADFPIVGENAVPEAIAAYAEKALSRAVRLGGKVAVLGSGKSRNIPENFPYSSAYRQLCDAFALCAEVADKYGMVITLEPLSSRETNFINTVAEALEICKQVDHPGGKCLADFFHVSQSGESLDAIRTAGALLAHVHIANSKRDMPHSEEDIEICALWAQALKDNGYSGRISLEGHYAPDFQADITQTRKILELFR